MEDVVDNGLIDPPIGDGELDIVAAPINNVQDKPKDTGPI